MTQTADTATEKVPQKSRRTLVGRVVSDKRAKTVTVQVDTLHKHPLYGKVLSHARKFHAHDENGDYHLGDLVEIAESRPISKTKSWTVTRLVQKAHLV